jgi:hypothetical protein
MAAVAKIFVTLAVLYQKIPPTYSTPLSNPLKTRLFIVALLKPMIPPT